MKYFQYLIYLWTKHWADYRLHSQRETWLKAAKAYKASVKPSRPRPPLDTQVTMGQLTKEAGIEWDKQWEGRYAWDAETCTVQPIKPPKRPY